MVNLGLIGLAFSSGAVTFLNPCSFALLPAYLSYFMGKRNIAKSRSKFRVLLKGIRNGSLASLGFATVFLGIGGLVSWIGPQVRSFLPPVLLVVGIVLVVLGFLWFLNIPALSLPSHGVKIELPRTSFYLFGVAYALSSLACVFPVFLMLLFSATAGGFISGLTVFFSFTLGMGSLMVITSASIALSKSFLIEKFETAKKYVTRVSGMILILAGIYLIHYWTSTYFL